MLPGLRHRTVRRRDNEHRAVHLRSTGNHVLDVVRVSGTVDVSVVAIIRLVLHVTSVDRDTALFFFRRVIDLLVAHNLGPVLRGTNHGHRGGQCGLTVVNVTDRTNVYVRFCPLKLVFGHCRPPCNVTTTVF